ncbi:Thioredoxin-domain-containing protein [Mycena chlorophos]|uniref:Thioredoxin-domain-containing protein n=1 Tax=Mycena chlorophos TaxID=658473 RepID=A0A8H6RX47_MYCCL|nr:Thioredoxin-domain-containing protein [Mycena chlorophos]
MSSTTPNLNQPIEVVSVRQWNDIMDSLDNQTIIVDFSAEWCPPCQAIAPKFSQLAAQNPEVQFLRVDVDEQPAIAQSFRVAAMPTFFAIKDKTVVGMLRGADPYRLAKLVKDHSTPSPEPEAPEPHL